MYRGFEEGGGTTKVLLEEGGFSRQQRFSEEGAGGDICIDSELIASCL